ncbi:diguanylate cyclase/phosphodiesterase with PAS/PAC sensor [Blastochloris viridis]|uniref:Diguanylate cyclase/phosphodiesterase with PAS/PAC sensor n=1 Tax=Blastochloris viridis TaxID=1079 RepID=A0A182CZR0_BLAVI|nr:diguanylate cyclase/phosphodiesterase with PAS/PAC sensor [Blastochloris viridis]
MRPRSSLGPADSAADLALAVLANLKLAVAVLDPEGGIRLANPRFASLFADASAAMALRAALQATAGGTCEVALDDGRVLRVQAAALAHDLLVTAEDVSDRVAAHARAAADARVDAVTGLGNGLLFKERLTALASVPEREAGPAAALTICLDRLREISEPLGQPLGEAVLRAAADRLRTATGPGDVVARLDDGKFAVLQLGQPQPLAATELAHRLVDLLGRPYILDGHLLTVEPHIGVALVPLDGQDGAQVLRAADMALSLARRHGRGGFRFFESAMEAQIQARRRLELDLRRALTLREFTLVYQPQVNVATGQITGFESLLRWNSANHGTVSPATFIPLAESSGLITALGAWGLRTACCEAARWPRPLSIAVNVSAMQVVDPGFLATIHGALTESGLAPERLELEITESVLLHDDGAALDVLRAVRDTGVRVSMDDFGTGYSSLSRLHSFPFDKIKIDQSFVRAGPDHPSGRAIVRAIAALGHALGIDTTAEGVETEEQFARVAADGCTEVQGYLISRPRPPEEIGELMQAPAFGARRST